VNHSARPKLKLPSAGRPPAGVVVDDASKRINEQRAFEVLVLRRFTVDPTRGDNGFFILDLRPVPVQILHRIVVSVHVFDIIAVQIRGLTAGRAEGIATGERD